MTARYPLVLNGTTIQELQSGDTIAGVPTTTGTSILKGDGSGGITNATGGTDYQTAQSVTGIVKSSGTTRSAAVAGTDYVPPSGTGATGSWGISITGSSASCTGNAATATTATSATNATNALGGPTSGQTWQNVTASRAINTTYTNSTGKPILVCITRSTSTSWPWSLIVDGVTICTSTTNTGNVTAPVTAIVQNGSTYQCSVGSGASSLWFELR